MLHTILVVAVKHAEGKVYSQLGATVFVATITSDSFSTRSTNPLPLLQAVTGMVADGRCYSIIISGITGSGRIIYF